MASKHPIRPFVALIASPVYNEPAMTDFFDGDGAWESLYKTEVDHCGAGAGVVDCVGTNGAQPSGGLFRLRQPLIFVSETGKHPYLAAPGLLIRYGRAAEGGNAKAMCRCVITF